MADASGGSDCSKSARCRPESGDLAFENMPQRELSRPRQVISWLESWGGILPSECAMTLIGSAALLWHVHRIGKDTSLPENSMDVDPVTSDEDLAVLCYDAVIGSEFEKEHGWHVNLMPAIVLEHLPREWEQRSSVAVYGNLTVTVPAVADLFVPKLKRGEPRDLKQFEFAKQLGLIETGESG